MPLLVLLPLPLRLPLPLPLPLPLQLYLYAVEASEVSRDAWDQLGITHVSGGQADAVQPLLYAPVGKQHHHLHT